MAAGQGLPMLFMGSEAHQGGHWHTTLETSFDWALLDDGPETFGSQGVANVAAANKVRAAHKSLTQGSSRVLHADADNGVLAVERFHEPTRERLIVVVNAGEQQWDDDVGTYGVNIGPSWGDDVGGFSEIYNSQSAAFGGWAGSGNAERGVFDQEGDMIHINIPKLSVMIIKQLDKEETFAAGEENLATDDIDAILNQLNMRD